MWGNLKYDKYDVLWSKLIRERDKVCRYCGKKGKLDAHHIFGRTSSMTRYDLDNGITLCPHHHVWNKEPKVSAHGNQEEFKKWIQWEIGLSEYRRLEKLSLKYKSRSQAKKEFFEKYGQRKKRYVRVQNGEKVLRASWYKTNG